MPETSDYAASSISTVELYIMFHTDMDFRANLDGLESFIMSRLGDDSLIYDFRAKEFSLGDFDDGLQLIRLSVELPHYVRNLKDGRVHESGVWLRRAAWAAEAIEEVLLPAYVWLFAEIGVANSHGLSYYCGTQAFDDIWAGRISFGLWLKSGFTDGVKLLPRTEILSGNYEGSWAQFRFILDDAKDYGSPKQFVESIRKELDDQYKED